MTRNPPCMRACVAMPSSLTSECLRVGVEDTVTVHLVVRAPAAHTGARAPLACCCQTGLALL